MKRLIHLVLLLAVVAAVAVAAVALLTVFLHPRIKGEGMIKTEDRTIADFSKVEVTGAFEIKWSGGKPALTISTDQNLLPLIHTVVNGDTLQIDSQGDLSPTKGITITLSSAGLTDVRLTGANSFKGSQITGPSLKLEATGASDLTVDGSVTNLEADLTGANHLDAKSLSAQIATISMVGASEANVTVTDTLNSSITGAGILTYAGHPKSMNNSVIGPGIVHSRP